MPNGLIVQIMGIAHGDLKAHAMYNTTHHTKDYSCSASEQGFKGSATATAGHMVIGVPSFIERIRSAFCQSINQWHFVKQ